MSTSSVAAPVGPTAQSISALRAWLAGAVGEAAAVTIGPPVDGQLVEVRLWPLALLPDQGLRCGGGQPVRLRIRYLICPTGAAAPALQVLDRILAATARDNIYLPVFEPISAATWQAFGVAPRAALLVDVAVRVDRDVPAVPRVRGQLHVDTVDMRSVRGTVLAPAGVPWAGIRVGLVGSDSATYTDSRGRFVLAGVTGTEPVRLRLSGKGLHLDALVQPDSADPIVIHCDLQEV